MREDLEATKQLLDLELRSKRLIEKENKRLAQELEKLKNEVYKGAVNGMTGSEPQKDETTTAKASRRNSVATKRHSVIRLLSESEGHDNVQDKDAENGGVDNNCNNGQTLDENDEEEEKISGNGNTGGTIPEQKADKNGGKSDTTPENLISAATAASERAAAAIAAINNFKPAAAAAPESFYDD